MLTKLSEYSVDLETSMPRLCCLLPQSARADLRLLAGNPETTDVASQPALENAIKDVRRARLGELA